MIPKMNFRQAEFRISIPELNVAFSCAQDETLLVAALRQGLILANSCRNGTCRTCLCQMDEGKVSYIVEWPGLSVDEKSESYILPCVARPLGNIKLRNVVLSQPQKD